LHIEIPSAELKEHIQERATHHKKRAEWYAQQVEQLQKGHQRSADQDRHGGSFDPLDGLLNKVSEHQHKAAFFQFMADHIVPDEKYRLSESDLARIELLSRYF
jgi:hypothetical protein